MVLSEVEFLVEEYGRQTFTIPITTQSESGYVGLYFGASGYGGTNQWLSIWNLRLVSE